MSSRGRCLPFIVCSAFLSTVPAFAVDGVIEINQARANAGNITAGDAPNFPVTIAASGSYRLTSDLTVPAGFDGIDVTASNVTLDLNGFNIVSLGGGVADGISLQSVQNVEIHNGTIRGFSRDGIFSNTLTLYIRTIGVRVLNNAVFGIDLEGQGNTVDRCAAINNNNAGIRVFDGSLVINTIARGHSSFGLILAGVGAGYGSCVLTGNNGGDANPQVSGGLQLGTNVCGTDTVCP